jgi:hypothetical protein
MKKYIIELEPGIWLAPWDGDPGRTHNIKSAKNFTSKIKARKALFQIKKDYPYRNFLNSCVRLVNI